MGGERMKVAALGYVRLQMREPAEWRQFGEEVLGFAAETGDDGSVRLKMDAAPFRYLVERGEQDRFAACGWECRSEAHYEGFLEALANAKALAGEGGEREAQARGVGRVAFAKDPSGNAFEIYHGRAVGGAFSSPIAGLEFVTEPMGLGHAVLPAPEFAATSAFYQDLLGFGLSDDLTLPPAAEGAPEQRLNFLHADNPRHHSLGLYNYSIPNGIVHVMAEANSLDSVGLCLDRVKAAGRPVVASLGRHFNDGMVSFYFLAPGGIPIEFGYDGTQHDWANFEPTRGSVADLWGHEYNFPS